MFNSIINFVGKLFGIVKDVVEVVVTESTDVVYEETSEAIESVGTSLKEIIIKGVQEVADTVVTDPEIVNSVVSAVETVGSFVSAAIKVYVAIKPIVKLLL